MSNEEFNNRNYYRGRFVSKVIDKRGEIITKLGRNFIKIN